MFFKSHFSLYGVYGISFQKGLTRALRSAPQTGRHTQQQGLSAAATIRHLLREPRGQNQVVFCRGLTQNRLVSNP